MKKTNKKVKESPEETVMKSSASISKRDKISEREVLAKLVVVAVEDMFEAKKQRDGARKETRRYIWLSLGITVAFLGYTVWTMAMFNI